MKMVFIILILFIAACNRPYNKEPACGFLMRKGLRLHHITTPVKLDIHVSVPTSAYPMIQNAANTWNTAVGYELIQLSYSSATGERESLRDGNSVIYWMSTWDESSTASATTRIISSGSVIYETDILINTTHRAFGVIDLESVLIHEMGHVLGLDHSNEFNSVMYPSLEPTKLRRELTAQDKSNILCVYQEGL